MSLISKRLDKYRNIRNLSRYVFRHTGKFTVSIIYGVSEQIFTLFSLLLGAYLTGLAFTGAKAEEISGYFLVLLAFIIAKGLFSYLHMYVCHEVAYMVLEDLRGDVYDALSASAPYNSVDYRTGDVSSIIMEDVETLEVFLAHIFGDYIIAGICMILFTGIYAYFSFGAAIVSFMASCIILTVPYWFSSVNESLGRSLREGLGQTNAGVVDSIQGLDEIVIFGAEKKFINKIKQDTDKLNKIEVKDGNVKGLQAGIIGFIMSAVLVYIVLLANNMVLKGSLSPVFTGAFIVMSLNVFFPVVMVSQSAGKIDAAAAASNRVYALLTKESPLKNGASDVTENFGDDESMVLSVRDVHFSYDKVFNKSDKAETLSNTVLEGVNLDIKKGENIVITGKSGAGKSTLMYLLMRFFDPDKGAVYLFGKNMRNMKPEDVRKNIAYVPQDVYIFHGTILDNLRLGKPDASIDEIKEALFKEAEDIRNEDVEISRGIGALGFKLLKKLKRNGKEIGIMTHCNAGTLATAKYGTATAPMYMALENGFNVDDMHVYCDETRPLLQGARLTAFELSNAGIKTTLQCDNMASILMKSGKIDIIFVGCDRVARNGDAANKIGTSGLAIIAKHYGIPFYVCAPTSTIDMKAESDKDIPIEIRDGEEITDMWYKERMAPENIGVYNPAFDVTDHSLITGIITEKGICKYPFDKAFKELGL